MQELQLLEESGQVRFIDEARFKRDLKARLADMRGLLARHILSARRLLKTLLDQPLRFEKVEEEGRWRYRIVGTGSYLPLLETAGDSLLPGKWCPQRDFIKGEPIL